MKYYADILKNKTMPFETTWVDLDIIILNEVRHRRQTSYINYI